MIRNIKVICFDQGGTLLYRVPLSDSGKADFYRIMEIAGISGDPIAFGKKLSAADKKYKAWSLKTNIEESEEDIWSHWFLPDIDSDRLKDYYNELTLLYSHSKGDRIFRSDAFDTIKELHNRGYLIAVVTNTVSRTLVPIELKNAEIWDFISALSMSSLTGKRKPKPDMFLDIANQLNVKPENCVYVGDAPNRDVAGPREAGFVLSILLKEDLGFKVESLSKEHKPDMLISSLNELLKIFKNPNQRN
jgi:putative hydrolase of the HAD superfamily